MPNKLVSDDTGCVIETYPAICCSCEQKVGTPHLDDCEYLRMERSKLVEVELDAADRNVLLDELIDVFFIAAKEWAGLNHGFVLIGSRGFEGMPDDSRLTEEYRAQMRYLLGAVHNAI